MASHAPEHDPPFRDPGGDPAFAECAVLFLDLLGTAGPHGEVEALDHLARTKRAVQAARALAGEDDGRALWRMTWFSDNLSIHYATRPSLGATQALGYLVTDVGFLQLTFLSEGFVARGAVTFGGFYADEEFIHGPALDRAVLLEKRRARYPRVVLDEAAVALAYHGLIAEEGGRISSPWRSQLLVDEDGTVFVDYLATLLEDRADSGWWQHVLMAHQVHIETNLQRYDGVAEIEEKYRWLAGYHNDFVDRYEYTIPDEDVPALRVASTRPLGRFKPFGSEVAPARAEGPGAEPF